MNKIRYSIWDKVVLISHDALKVYIVYSYTTYIDRVWYTIWHDDEYLSIDEWQIEPYVEVEPIWFTTLTD